MLLHQLDDPGYRTGAKLASSAVDRGFRVFQFGLGEVTVAPVAGDVVQVMVTYDCGLFVWLPGTVGEGGLIAAVDALIEAQPLRVEAAPAVLAAGAGAQVRIAGVSGSRLVDVVTGTREPVRIAGCTANCRGRSRRRDRRGSAALAGFRVFPVTGPETVAGYTPRPARSARCGRRRSWSTWPCRPTGPRPGSACGSARSWWRCAGRPDGGHRRADRVSAARRAQRHHAAADRRVRGRSRRHRPGQRAVRGAGRGRRPGRGGALPGRDGRGGGGRRPADPVRRRHRGRGGRLAHRKWAQR